MSDVTAEEKAVIDGMFHQCPMCDSQLEAPVKVNEEDVREYFRCTLTGKPFKKVFKFLDGDIVCVLQDVTLDAMDFLMKEGMDLSDESDVMIKISRIKFIQMCERVEINGETIFDKESFEGETSDDYLKAYAACVKNNPALIGNLLASVVESMTRLMNTALNEAIAKGSF